MKMNRVAMATSTLLGIDINVVVMIYLPTYLEVQIFGKEEGGRKRTSIF